MKTHKLKQLMQKGWNSEQLAKAIHILERKNEEDVNSHRIVYWSTLLTTVVGNILLTLTLIPFLLFLTNPVIYVLTIIIAMLTGTIYAHLIDQINHLTQTHHIAAMTLLPTISLVTVIGIVTVSNHLASVWNIPQKHHPLPIAILFAISFLIPTIGRKLYYSNR